MLFQIMRSLCQENCEADVKIMRSRCQAECEADAKATAKPMSRRYSHAHTSNGSTHAHKQIGAKLKHVVIYILSMFAFITSLHYLFFSALQFLQLNALPVLTLDQVASQTDSAKSSKQLKQTQGKPSTPGSQKTASTPCAPHRKSLRRCTFKT